MCVCVCVCVCVSACVTERGRGRERQRSQCVGSGESGGVLHVTAGVRASDVSCVDTSAHARTCNPFVETTRAASKMETNVDLKKKQKQKPNSTVSSQTSP